MCREANIGGNKTNHSLRATGATELLKRMFLKRLFRRELVTFLLLVSGNMKGPILISSELYLECCHAVRILHSVSNCFLLRPRIDGVRQSVAYSMYLRSPCNTEAVIFSVKL